MKFLTRSFGVFVLVLLIIIPFTQVRSQSNGNYFQSPVAIYKIFQSSTTDCHFASKSCYDKSKYHTAIDLSSGVKAKVMASAPGHVALIQQNYACDRAKGSCLDHGMGKTVIIEHTLSTGEIVYSMYSHLDRIADGLSVGQCVKSGTDLGTVGGSGYGSSAYWGIHLHFEIKTNKTLGDPKYNNQFGYTSSDPTSLGYKNPEKYVNNRSIIVQDCALSTEVNQFIQGLQKEDATAISGLASSGLLYAYQIEGGQRVTSLQFKEDLNKRLNSHPTCDGIWESSGDIWVWTNKWTPTWVINQLCYESCTTLKTPHTGAQVGFRFRKYGSKYQLDRVWVGSPTSLAPGVNMTLTSCAAYSKSIALSGSPTTASPTSTPSNCTKSPAPHLKVGTYAIVSNYSTLNNNVRVDALMTSYVSGVLKPGATMKILDGPKCSGGYYWWKVSAINSQLTGWTVEGDQTNYWLLPCATLSQCKP